MRFPALLTAVVALMTALALVVVLPAPPPARAQGSGGGASGSGSGPASAAESDAWTPGELDVDWAAFAAGQGGFQAAAAADPEGEAARADVRDQARAAYAEATGAPEAAAYADLQPQRGSALASQYYDECDDGTNLPDGGVQASREALYRGGATTTGGLSYNPGDPAPPPAVDLRSTFIVQSTDAADRFDQTAFLAYACEEWGFDDLGRGGIAFGLYTTFEEDESQYPTVLGDPESGPDFVVAIFPERNVPSRPYQVMAVRTPSRDQSTWTMTFLDEAGRLDGYQIDGVVPTSAIGDFTAASGFAWTVESVDAQPVPGRDWFPERNWLLREGEGDEEVVGTHIPQFPVPEDCGVQTEAAPGRISYALTPQAVTPDDDGYPVQWAHPAIGTPAAWDTIRDSSAGGRERPVTVAVVDTGIDATRFDFLDGGARVVGGLDAVYGLELEGGDNAGAIGPIIGPRAVAYERGATPRNSDRDPHGTGVASLIGARGNNRFGIAGVDWGARLMPIRVNDANGCISNVVVAEGIKWAVDHGADVVHISLGAAENQLFTPPGEDPATPECADGIDNDRDGTTDYQPPAGASPDLGCEDAEDGSEGRDVAAGGDGGADATPACADGRDNDGDDRTDLADGDCASAEDDLEGPDGESREVDPLRETIDYALEQGVPVIAAAGNLGGGDDPVMYPAAYPGVIAVGATTRQGARASYSATGRWLHVVAPGGSNSRTLDGDLAALWELDRIRSVAGTSFAAPLVTGAVSLYMGLNPHITRGFRPAGVPAPDANLPDTGYQRTVDDVRIALQAGARDVAPAGHDPLTGWGRLDVDRVLDVEALGGPLADPATGQLPRTAADAVVAVTEELALSRPEAFPAFAVLARADVAVDALAGAPLLADGPLLVSRPGGVAASTMRVLDQLLPGGGRVYLLGGEQALPAAIARQLADAGHEVVRLAGGSRYETAVAIAEEVRRLRPGTSEVGLVRADGGDDPTAQWADALTGGAWAAASGTPLLVTGTDALHPAAADAMTRWGTTRTTLLGGTAALGPAVEAAVPAPRRVAGSSRAGTAVAVAEQLWGPHDGYLLTNGTHARGWAAGLAAAGWAADTDRPLLYTGVASAPAETIDLLGRRCGGAEAVHLVGGASLIGGTAESALLEATTC